MGNEEDKYRKRKGTYNSRKLRIKLIDFVTAVGFIISEISSKGRATLNRRRFSAKYSVLFGFTVSMTIILVVVSLLRTDVKGVHPKSQGTPTKASARRRPIDSVSDQVVHRRRTQIDNTVLNNDLCKTYSSNYLLRNMLPKWDKRLKNAKADDDDEPNAFKQKMNNTEYRMLFNVFSIYKDVCDSNDIEFFLFGDSLLGAYRHFGMIPWGERLHVMVNSKAANKMIYLLNSLNGYECTTLNGVDWAFTLKNTSFEVNIKFFQENNEFIWDFDEYGYPILFLNKTDIFPLACSPFEGFLVRVPRKMQNVLENVILVDKCIGQSPVDENDAFLERVEMVPCENLYPYYPFVFESIKNNMTVRELKGDGKLISTYIVKDLQHSENLGYMLSK